MRTHLSLLLVLPLLLAAAVTACGGTLAGECGATGGELVVDAGAPELDAAPPDAPSVAELCALDRNPEYPCITFDGTMFRHGECCVQDGVVGWCGGYTVDTGPSLLPICETP